jgi:hypothetical protein
MRHGNIVLNARHARGGPSDVISGLAHEARTNFTGQLHDVIQCLHAYGIDARQIRMLIDLALNIRRNLRIA